MDLLQKLGQTNVMKSNYYKTQTQATQDTSRNSLVLVLSGSNPPIRPSSFLSNLFPLVGIPLAPAQPPERPLLKDSSADIVGL